MTPRDGVTDSFMIGSYKGTLLYLLIAKYEGAFFACKN